MSFELARAYEGRKVLVTGHTGFKGGWLVTWLNKLGTEVSGYSLAPATSPSLFEAADVGKNVHHLEGDVRDRESLRLAFQSHPPEVVFHLAAQPLVRESYRDPVGTISTNVMGVVNVLDEVRRARKPCAVVVVTSDKCYENVEWHYGYREIDRLGGGDPYSASKAASEILIESYRRAYFSPGEMARHGIGVASARAGNVIGGGDWSEDRILPDCIRALSSGAPLRVRNPDAVRPWQHVLEPVSGYLALGAALLGERASEFCEAWNFGPESGSVWPVRAVVERVIERWGKGRWEADAATGPLESTLLSLSIEKTRARLGWAPRWTLERAIAETVDWYRAFDEGRSMRELCERQISAYEENG